MLYILFGRDHIGKKTVRDFICKTYGIIMIPKYTDDKHKTWVLHDYNGHTSTEKFTLPNDFVKLREIKRTFHGAYICDDNDPYLRWLSDENKQNIDAYCYEITKIYNTDQYQARYYIRVDDIERALKDSDNDYMLVCASGETIKAIEHKARDLNLAIDRAISIVHVEGDGISNKRASWKYIPTTKDGQESSDKEQCVDLPAAYLFEFSQKFIGRIRNTTYKTIKNCIDQEKFENNISLQWENVTGMLPVRPRVFIVRPFRENECTDETENINDLVEKEIVGILKEKDSGNVLKFGRLTKEELGSASSIFEAMDRQIQQCHIIIIDLREHRRNCYYEYGYAMGLRKAYNHCKHIFCLIGVEAEYDKEESRDELIERLHQLELAKAYDVIPFPHYKYVCSKEYDIDENPKAKVEFIKESNTDRDFQADIATLLSIPNKKKQINVADLAISKKN